MLICVHRSVEQHHRALEFYEKWAQSSADGWVVKYRKCRMGASSRCVMLWQYTDPWLIWSCKKELYVAHVARRRTALIAVRDSGSQAAWKWNSGWWHGRRYGPQLQSICYQQHRYCSASCIWDRGWVKVRSSNSNWYLAKLAEPWVSTVDGDEWQLSFCLLFRVFWVIFSITSTTRAIHVKLRFTFY